jgi:hypothetical protein
MYDLNNLLDEVIQKYDTPEGYKRPTISWSSENMKTAFGRYDYWSNSISISRCLNADQISKEALLSVIYHEIWHQESSDDSDDFQKKVLAFPNYKMLGKEMTRFLKNQEDCSAVLKTTKEEIDYSQAIICVIPNGDNDDYLDNFQFYNRYFHVYLGENRHINKEFTDLINPPIIWLAKNKTKYYVVGWSVENQIFEYQQNIRQAILEGYDLDYQIKTRNKGYYLLPVNNCTCSLTKTKLPENFEEQGICFLNELKDVAKQRVINFIETYDAEILPIGLTDAAIEACAPLIETDTNVIIEKSLAAENDIFRSLCLANLGAKQDPCLATVYNRADALRWATFFEEALIEFEKAYKMEPTEIEIIGSCILMNVILDNIEKAKYYLNLLSDEDINNIESVAARNSIEILKNNLRNA